MRALTEEHARQQASNELGFLQALKVAVPACFDGKAESSYEKRESKLLTKINGRGEWDW